MSKQEDNNTSPLDSPGVASFKGSNVGRPVNGFTESSVPLGAIRAMKGMAGMEGMGIMRVIRPSGTDTPCYSSVRQYGGYGGYGAPGDKSAPVAAPDPSQPSTDLTAPASIPRRGPGRPRKVPPPLNLTHTQVPLAPKPDKLGGSKQRVFSQTTNPQVMIQQHMQQHIQDHQAGQRPFNQRSDSHQVGTPGSIQNRDNSGDKGDDRNGDSSQLSQPNALPSASMVGNTPPMGAPQGLASGSGFPPGNGGPLSLPISMEPLTPIQVQQVENQARQQARQQLQSLHQQEHRQLSQQHQIQMQALRQQQEAQQHPIRRHALTSEALNEYRQQQQIEHQQQQQQLLQQHQQQIQQLQQKHQQAMEYRQEQLFKEIEQLHLIQHQATLLAVQMSRSGTDPIHAQQQINAQQQVLVNSLGIPNFMSLSQPGQLQPGMLSQAVLPQSSPRIDGQQQIQMPQMPPLSQQVPQDSSNFGPSPMAWLQSMCQQLQLQSTLANMHSPYDRPLEQYQQQIQQQIQAIQSQQAQFQEAQAQVQAQAAHQAQQTQDHSQDTQPVSDEAKAQKPTQEAKNAVPETQENDAKEHQTKEHKAEETQNYVSSQTNESKTPASKPQEEREAETQSEDQAETEAEIQARESSQLYPKQTQQPQLNTEPNIPQELLAVNDIEPATIKLEPDSLQQEKSETKGPDSIEKEGRNEAGAPQNKLTEIHEPRGSRNGSSVDENGARSSSASLPSASSISSSSVSEPVSAKRRPAPLPIARFAFPQSAPNSAVPEMHSSGTPPSSAPGSAMPPTTETAPNSGMPLVKDTQENGQLQNPSEYANLDPFAAMQSYYQKLLQSASGGIGGQPGMHPNLMAPFSPYHPPSAPTFGFPNQMPFGMGFMPQNMQMPNGMPSAWPTGPNGMPLPMGMPGMVPPPPMPSGGSAAEAVSGQQGNPASQMDFLRPIPIGPITPLTPLTPSNSQGPSSGQQDQLANDNVGNQRASIAPFNTPDGRQKLDNKPNAKLNQSSGQGGSTSVFRVGRSYQSFNPPNESNTGGVFTGRRPPGRPRKYALRTLGSIPPVVLPSGVNVNSKAVTTQSGETNNNRPPARFRIEDSDSDNETSGDAGIETIESGEPISKRPKRQSLVSNLPRPPPPPRPRGRRPFKTARSSQEEDEGQNPDGSQKIPRSERYWLDQQSQFMNDLDEMGFEVVMTSDYTYMCSLCGKSFNSRLLCIRHAAEHLSRKAFWCIECGLEFTRCDTLQRHYKGRCEKRLADRAGRSRPIVKEHWEVRTNTRSSPVQSDDQDDKMDVELVDANDADQSDFRNGSGTTTKDNDALSDQEDSSDNRSSSRAPAPVMPESLPRAPAPVMPGADKSDDRTISPKLDSQKSDNTEQPDAIKPEGDITTSSTSQLESKSLSRAPAPVMPLNSESSETRIDAVSENTANSERFSPDDGKTSPSPHRASIPDPVQPPQMTSC